MSELPAPLREWAPALAPLSVELAIALGPMVRRIAELLSTSEPVLAPSGEPEGYEGLGLRGPPERIAVSEWLLASELPDEFLRRAAVGELLYLAPGFRATRPRGRVAVLCDAGPDQLGAARLVQLAALIVLHRRATDAGSELVLGAFGDPAGTWRAGPIDALLDGWLHARRAYEPDGSDVDDWLTGADEVWVLAGPRLGALLRGRRRVLVSRESTWDDAGVRSVELSFDGRRAELALPPGDVAIRALRGAGFGARPPTATQATGPLRFITFPSNATRLIARGPGDDEIITVPVPTGTPRSYRFAGPVLAASVLGRRLAALVHTDGVLTIRTAGKRLPHLERMEIPPDAIGADPAATGLPSLFLSGDGVLVLLAREWWLLTPRGTAQRMTPILDVVPGTELAAPRWVSRSGERLVVSYASGLQIPGRATVLLRGTGDLAWSVDGRDWKLVPAKGTVHVSVAIDHGTEVLGVIRSAGSPALLVLSSGGLVLRVATPTGVRTLTRWSGIIGRPVLHPSRPWLAVPRAEGRIDVVDLDANRLLRTVTT